MSSTERAVREQRGDQPTEEIRVTDVESNGESHAAPDSSRERAAVRGSNAASLPGQPPMVAASVPTRTTAPTDASPAPDRTPSGAASPGVTAAPTVANPVETRPVAAPPPPPQPSRSAMPDVDQRPAGKKLPPAPPALTPPAPARDATPAPALKRSPRPDLFDREDPAITSQPLPLVRRTVVDAERHLIAPVSRPVRRRPRVRKVTRVLRHVDPWSVFKIAAVFSIVLYGIMLTAGVLLWNVAYSTGTVDNLEQFFESFGWTDFQFKGGEIYHSAWIGGLFIVVALTGFAVLGATLFNLVTDLVGGVRMTVLEEEVVERTDSPMRRFTVRRAAAGSLVEER